MPRSIVTIICDIRKKNTNEAVAFKKGKADPAFTTGCKSSPNILTAYNVIKSIIDAKDR